MEERSDRSTYTYPLALVFLGVPLPGKHNPYIVLVSREEVVRVEVSLGEAEKPSARLEPSGLGWRLELALKSFVDELSARLEQPLEAELRFSWSRVEVVPAASLYAAATLALVTEVAEAGGYEMEPGEVLEAASSIDVEAGVWLDYLDALRRAMVEGRSMTYRHGEEPVLFEEGRRLELELVGEEDIGEDIAVKLGDNLLTAYARLLGLLVVEAAGALRSGDWGPGDFQVAARLENGAYYSLYGAEPPPEGCKWTPSLQRVYGVCRPGAGVGEAVAFTL